MTDDTVYVTQPTLPPLEEFIPYLRQIWDSKRLTNNGPMHQQLECALREYFRVRDVVLFCNGTVAILAALRALNICGEVITTPFSFVATSHAIRWSGLLPTFVDTAPGSFNIDPDLIERAITPDTVALMPVHCYGYPCDTAAIAEIANRHGLKVIYDAAHAFGVEDHGGSLLAHGDLSVLSFHATKVFTTLEGGAVVCHDEEAKRRLMNVRNFGIANETTVLDTGINGKLNEISAAFGLLQLEHVAGFIESRAAISQRYRDLLSGIPGIWVPPPPEVASANHSYFPVLVTPDFPMGRDALYDFMRANGVHPRRYFYPLITEHSMYRDARGATRSNLPNAAVLSDQILCLPIYPELELAVVESIADLITDAARSSRPPNR